MPAGIAVRLARPDELKAAGEVVLAAYLADGYDVGGYAATLADAVARSREAEVAVAVAVDGDGGGGGATVIGSVTFAVPGSRWAELARPGQAEFRMLGVDPAHRGVGAGRLLIDWCVQRAGQVGARSLVLCSMAEMAAAHRLYVRLGFSRRPDLDWRPEPNVLLLGFELPLNGPRA